MSRRRYATKTHGCSLLGEADDIVNDFIDSGVFVQWRRRFKRFTMISMDHPLSRFYIQSILTLRYEEHRHLVYSFYIIHPFSMWQFWWRIIVSLTLCLSFFLWTSSSALPTYRRIIFTIPDVIYIIFILSLFFTGYYEEAGHIILGYRKVIRRYLLTYFIFDFLSVTPLIFSILITTEIYSHQGSSAYSILFKLLPLLKFLRYAYFLETTNQVRLYYGMNHYLYRAVRTCVNLIFILVLVNTILFGLTLSYPDQTMSYLKCMRFTLETLLMVCAGNQSMKGKLDVVYPIVFILVGFILHLFLSVHIFQLWCQFYSAETKQLSAYNAITAFMTYKALPQHIRERTFLYLDFKYQNSFYKNSAIQLITTESLRKEVLIATTQKSIQSVEFLQRVPQDIIKKLMASLVQEIYLPNDIIIKAGTVGRCMFFILVGTAMVTTSDERVVCYLRDGSHFGEISLVAKMNRIANVIAFSPIEVYRLSRKKFLDILKAFPDLMRTVEEVVISRISDFQQISDEGFKEKKIAVELLRKQREEKDDFQIVGEELGEGDED